MTLDANKALVRRVFEEVIPSGDATAMRDLVAPDFLDHDPLPGQPAGAQGAEYVVTTMHGAHPDLRFTIDELVAALLEGRAFDASRLPADDLNINSACDIQRGGVEAGIARFSINDIPGTDSYGTARIRAAE